MGDRLSDDASVTSAIIDAYDMGRWRFGDMDTDFDIDADPVHSALAFVRRPMGM